MDVGQNYVLRENLNTYPFNQGQNKQCLYKLRQFKPKIIASNCPRNITLLSENKCKPSNAMAASY